MDFGAIAQRGLVLVGCGRMGGALLQGWLAGGLPPSSAHVLEPAPAPWLRASGVHLDRLPDSPPAALVLAVKPQMMEAALPSVVPLAGGGTLVLSIAAGTPLAAFEAAFGSGAAIVRAMPNTPAAIGQGITALVGNRAASMQALALAEGLMGAVGETVILSDEAQMDAVTAVSGSGPAYLFHMIEALSAAGIAAGLPEELATRLARATVTGSGALAAASSEPAAALRAAVTSPGGTTAAALEVLMDAREGLPPLMVRAVAAAAARSRELAGQGA